MTPETRYLLSDQARQKTLDAFTNAAEWWAWFSLPPSEDGACGPVALAASPSFYGAAGGFRRHGAVAGEVRACCFDATGMDTVAASVPLAGGSHGCTFAPARSHCRGVVAAQRRPGRRIVAEHPCFLWAGRGSGPVLLGVAHGCCGRKTSPWRSVHPNPPCDGRLERRPRNRRLGWAEAICSFPSGSPRPCS